MVSTLNSPFLIILLYNFKNSSLSFNQLIFSNISFLIFFSLSKKVLVPLCKPFLSKPLGSYLFLVSLCKPSLSKSSLSKPSLSKPVLSKPLGSYLFLASLCKPSLSKPSLSKPSLSKPSKLYFVPVSLCKSPSSRPSLSKLYFSVSSGSTLNSVFLIFSYIFNFSGFFF